MAYTVCNVWHILFSFLKKGVAKIIIMGWEYYHQYTWLTSELTSKIKKGQSWGGGALGTTPNWTLTEKDALEPFLRLWLCHVHLGFLGDVDLWLGVVGVADVHLGQLPPHPPPPFGAAPKWTLTDALEPLLRLWFRHVHLGFLRDVDPGLGVVGVEDVHLGQLDPLAQPVEDGQQVQHEAVSCNLALVYLQRAKQWWQNTFLIHRDRIRTSNPLHLSTGVWEKVWNNLKCLKRCAFQCIKSLKMWFCEEQKSLKSDSENGVLWRAKSLKSDYKYIQKTSENMYTPWFENLLSC